MKKSSKYWWITIGLLSAMIWTMFNYDGEGAILFFLFAIGSCFSAIKYTSLNL